MSGNKGTLSGEWSSEAGLMTQGPEAVLWQGHSVCCRALSEIRLERWNGPSSQEHWVPRMLGFFFCGEPPYVFKQGAHLRIVTLGAWSGEFGSVMAKAEDRGHEPGEMADGGAMRNGRVRTSRT